MKAKFFWKFALREINMSCMKPGRHSYIHSDKIFNLWNSLYCWSPYETYEVGHCICNFKAVYFNSYLPVTRKIERLGNKKIKWRIFEIYYHFYYGWAVRRLQNAITRSRHKIFYCLALRLLFPESGNMKRPGQDVADEKRFRSSLDRERCRDRELFKLHSQRVNWGNVLETHIQKSEGWHLCPRNNWPGEAASSTIIQTHPYFSTRNLTTYSFTYLHIYNYYLRKSR